MIPKIMTLYLPQFHEVKENSMWYGEGFTDWTAVKNAKPLFQGHMQPKIPLNHNYYDLSNIKSLKWQAELAKKYHVDGFCFYHYWFDSNKKLLEKPSELLLAHKEINIEFCFSWVNESWKRTWSNVKSGNVWCDLYDDKSIETNIKNRGVLVKQRYGREEEWMRHIEYLIPFFQDDRYLKIDGKPVFCIYQPCEILCLQGMMEVWNSTLKEKGMEGIYLIGASYGDVYSDKTDINYNHEPGTTFAKCRALNEYTKKPGEIEIFDYDIMWGHILTDVQSGKLSCAFTEFDSTPRKGNKGSMVQGGNALKFGKYFKDFLKENIQAGNEIIFINAWNEWGEGMYLEPSEDNGYLYLEAIRDAIQDAGTCKTESKSTKTESSDWEPKQKQSNAVLRAEVLNQWLSASRNGFRAEMFFDKYHYEKIAIYGMGILGRQLVDELSASKITILFYMDQRDVLIPELFRKVSIQDELPKVDCIVVTALAEFEKIYEVLREKSDAAIVNIGEIFEDFSWR